MPRPSAKATEALLPKRSENRPKVMPPAMAPSMEMAVTTDRRSGPKPKISVGMWGTCPGCHARKDSWPSSARVI